VVPYILLRPNLLTLAMRLCDAVMRCAYAMRLCEALYDALCDAPMRCDYAMRLCEALYDASIRLVNVHMGLPSPRDPEEALVTSASGW
jgi:hypothetical protein